MMKKYIFFLCIIIGISKIINAQPPLVVDAGKDTNYCIGFYSELDTIHIGGKPTAKGGVAPYKYEWTVYSTITHKPSTVLYDNNIDHDSIIAAPSNFIARLNDIYVFKITVTDANGIKVSDSTVIGLSMIYMGASIGHDPFILNEVSDMGVLIDGGVPPLSYKWTPSIGLSNDTIQFPKVFVTSVPIKYSVELTDKIGCKSSDATITDIKNGDLKIGFVSFKNPILNSGTLNFTSDLLGSILQVYSVNGVLQYQMKVEDLSIPLGSLIPTAGVYFYRVTTPLGKLITGRFVRE